MLTSRVTILVEPEEKEKWMEYCFRNKISLGELIRWSVEEELKQAQENKEKSSVQQEK